MKRMTYRKMMSLVETGDAVICATDINDDSFVILETYDRQGRAKREEVQVTNTVNYFADPFDKVIIEPDGDVLWAKPSRR